jgi:hypothetical protein
MCTKDVIVCDDLYIAYCVNMYVPGTSASCSSEWLFSLWTQNLTTDEQIAIAVYIREIKQMKSWMNKMCLRRREDEYILM